MSELRWFLGGVGVGMAITALCIWAAVLINERRYRDED